MTGRALKIVVCSLGAVVGMAIGFLLSVATMILGARYAPSWVAEAWMEDVDSLGVGVRIVETFVVPLVILGCGFGGGALALKLLQRRAGSEPSDSGPDSPV